jgi:hypothetical protein
VSSPKNTLTQDHLAEILALDGIPFVRRAYLTILQRPADAAGERSYVRSLLRGGAKEDVLVSLRLSAEGRKVGVDIPDFARLRLRRSIRQILRAISPRFVSSKLRHRFLAAGTSAANIPREDVAACFRLFFRRHPGEDEILDYQLGYSSHDAMLEGMCTSEEFLSSNEDVLLAFFGTNGRGT